MGKRTAAQIARAERNRRYSASRKGTAAGCAARKRYMSSRKGVAAKKRWNAAYTKTSKGRQAILCGEVNVSSCAGGIQCTGDWIPEAHG